MRLIDADALLKHKDDHEMISTHLVWNAPTIEPKQEWIPVSKRLPEEYAEVLLCVPNEEIYVGYLVGKSIDGTPIWICSKNGDSDWLGFAKAWMPLPKTYREEECER